MYQELHTIEQIPIGFGRSLLWAVGVTGVASVVAASLSSAHLPWLFPGDLLAAAILYPLTTETTARHAARGALVAALLLVPLIDSAPRPLASMLAAAIVIGLLRSWRSWTKGRRSHWLRELSCATVSLSLGGFLFDEGPLGLGFGIWGFCLGQLVATLFGGAGECAQ